MAIIFMEMKSFTREVQRENHKLELMLQPLNKNNKMMVMMTTINILMIMMIMLIKSSHISHEKELTNQHICKVETYFALER